MFDFENPYYHMFLTKSFNVKPKSTVLHHRTCPICDSKLVNVYYVSQLDKYICKKCIDNKGEEND